eukprot:TRINITY_DN3873_c0_g1_i1.p1 TRINITY_DN3873_c0_g1~~TRINITY_DN3873_c0_g1_i1.p1  ORF type:complete len:375 (+),score=62.35 TRINITY_DN3873_c0_g1_i1:65-1189(+)
MIGDTPKKLLEFETPGTVYDLNFHDNWILCATENSVLVFDMAKDEDIPPRKYCFGKHKSRRESVVPLRLAPSQHIHKVVGHATVESAFFTLQNNTMSLWSMESPDNEPTLSQKVSSKPMLALSCDTFHTNALALGGFSKAIKVLDLRKGDRKDCVVWRRANGHDSTIHDVKWNPFVPHWLATCGGDGLIHLWDLRYGKNPVVTLEGHTNTVTHLAWSRHRAEMLTSAGSDGSLKVWDLTACGSKFVGGVNTQNKQENPLEKVIGLNFRKDENTVVAATQERIISLAVTEKYLDEVREAAGKPVTEPYRKHLYYRRWSTLANLLGSDAVVEQFSPNTPKDYEFSVDEELSPADFAKDLVEYSQDLPPNFQEREYF